MFSSSPIVSGSSGMSISLALIIFWISTIEYWSILYGSQTWPSSAFEQTLFPSRRLITTFLGILTLKLAKMFWIRVIILRIIWLLLGLVCSLFGIVPPLLSSDAIKTTAIVRSNKIITLPNDPPSSKRKPLEATVAPQLRRSSRHQ